MPKELWPAEWRAKQFHKPMVLLVKALYGHPESGGHWERHLERAVKLVGGVPVENHPSSFWFPKQKCLMTVYVDDLLLAGPKENHAEIWKKLRDPKLGDIRLEDPSPLERFLGRHHDVVQLGSGVGLAYNMEEYCQSTVEVYTKLTGVTKFKYASTPFVPDGSITVADLEETGELDGPAKILMKALWLARLARPDILKPICDLASHAQKWSRACDKKIYRLMCYLHSTPGHRLVAHVGDDVKDLMLRLYADADFAGDKAEGDCKSTSGGWLCLRGPNTHVPLAWVAKKQTSTSRSTTEAEIVSLAYSLFGEAVPTWDFWQMMLGEHIYA